jgi:hypothetical protein
MASTLEDKKPAPQKEKPTAPVRCACGQYPVLVRSNGKNMAACPNMLVCGLRSGWFGKEQDAIKNWNTVQEEKKSRRPEHGKKRKK